MLTKIHNLIKEIVGKDVDFVVEVPTEKEFGDYSTNVAFKMAPKEKKPPLALAHELIKKIAEADKENFFDRVSAAEPGFINFWISKKSLINELGNILKQKNSYGKIKKTGNEAKKINVEFISANPTGPLTLGNGRGAFLGNALANTLEANGHEITREYYINDAKSGAQIKELGKTALGQGETYKNPYFESKAKKLGKRIKGLKPEEAGYLLAQEIQKDSKKFIEKKLGIKFDVWFSEESLYQKNLTGKILDAFKKSGLTYEKDGALWFKATSFGDSEDRVIIRSTGEPTYFLSDTAYHFNKLVERKFDKAIDIWGADHHGYILRLKAGLKALKIDPKKFDVIVTQLVRLIKDGEEIKMSKRKGVYVTLAELIKEVGKDAAAFFFLMTTPDSHMDFDLALAKEKSLKNPVYYAQYATVRCGAILKKAKTKSLNPDLDLLNSESELKLIRELIRLPDIIKQAAEDYGVHRLTHYALEIARSLHNFYEKERVIIEDKKLMTARLALISATKIVLENLFDILGISAPKKM